VDLDEIGTQGAGGLAIKTKASDLSEVVDKEAGPQFWFKPGALGRHNLVGIGHSQDLRYGNGRKTESSRRVA
jgi:hypothetical protein